MNLNAYYNQLMEYKNIFDLKVTRGEMDYDKGVKLVNKLNEWFEHAKFESKMNKGK